MSLPYKWKQTLGDVDVTVPLPKGTRGRDLDIVIEKKRIRVGLKNQAPIFEVLNFFKPIPSFGSIHRVWSNGHNKTCFGME